MLDGLPPPCPGHVMVGGGLMMHMFHLVLGLQVLLGILVKGNLAAPGAEVIDL